MMAEVNVTQIGMVIAMTALALLYQLELDYDPLVVQRTAVVARDPDDVFRFLADILSYPKWTGLIQHVESLDNSALGVGKSFDIHMTVPTGIKRYHTIVQTYQPYNSLSLDIDMPLLRPIILLEVAEDNKPGVAKVTLSIYSQRRSYLFKSAILPLSRIAITGHVQGALFHMKLLMQQ